MKKVNWFVVLAGGAVGLAAVLLTGLGVRAQMMPVPRKLSSSCGTCVRYLAEEANLSAMDEDVEAVYEKIGKEEYTLLMDAE